MNIAIVGDLQVHPYTQFSSVQDDGCNSRVADIIDALECATQICQQQDVAIAVQLGDIFESRTTIDALTEVATSRAMAKLGKSVQRLAIVTGNHDRPLRAQQQTSDETGDTRDSWNIAELFRYHPHTVVHATTSPIATGSSSVRLLAAPHGTTKQALEQAIDKCKPHVIFAHLDIKGALFNDSLAKCTDGFDSALGVPVYNGHYHNRQSIGDVNCIGALTHLNFNDRPEERGITVITIDEQSGAITNEQFVPIASPRFVTLIGEGKQLSFNGRLDSCYVKVRGTDLDEITLRTTLTERGAQAVVFDGEQTATTSTRLESVAMPSLDVAQLIKEFVLREQSLKDTSDAVKQRLIDVGLEITRNVQAIVR